MPDTRLPRSRWGWLRHIPAAMLAILLALGLIYVAFVPTGRQVDVASLTWKREVEIERRIEQFNSDWCDRLPAQARVIKRKLTSDPSGSRTGEHEHCVYAALAWRTVRRVQAEGKDAEPPLWPDLHLADLPANDPGAERAGPRHEHYEVALARDDLVRWTCPLPLERWRALAVGQQLRLQVDRGGVAHCDGLSAPK